MFEINSFSRYSSHTLFDDAGFPVYKRRKTGNTITTRNGFIDNQWVVPYNRDLLVMFQCHINVEVCNDGRCMKYLFKYCLKGPDRATLLVKSQSSKNDGNIDQSPEVDEIKHYLDGR